MGNYSRDHWNSGHCCHVLWWKRTKKEKNWHTGKRITGVMTSLKK